MFLIVSPKSGISPMDDIWEPSTDIILHGANKLWEVTLTSEFMVGSFAPVYYGVPIVTYTYIAESNLDREKKNKPFKTNITRRYRNCLEG